MTMQTKRATVYLDPDLHKALRLKSRKHHLRTTTADKIRQRQEVTL